MMTYFVIQVRPHMCSMVVSLLQNLIQKLKPGGRMVIPVGEQNAMQVHLLPFHKHCLQFFLELQQFVWCSLLRSVATAAAALLTAAWSWLARVLVMGVLSCLLGTYHLNLNLVISHMRIHLCQLIFGQLISSLGSSQVIFGVKSTHLWGVERHRACFVGWGCSWLVLLIEKKALAGCSTQRWHLSSHSCHINIEMAADAALRDKDLKHKLMCGNGLVQTTPPLSRHRVLGKVETTWF